MDKSRFLVKQQDLTHLASYDTTRTEFRLDLYVLIRWREVQPPCCLHCRWKGPMRIISFTKCEYILLDSITNKEKSYHISDIKEFLYDLRQVNPVDVARKDYSEFFISKIFYHRGYPKKISTLEFLV